MRNRRLCCVLSCACLWACSSSPATSPDSGASDSGAADAGGEPDAGMPDAGPLTAAPGFALYASSPLDDDYFGGAVALSRDGARAIVGAYQADVLPGAFEAGTATVFARDGSSWSEEATLRASDAQAGDQLGYSVALSADGTRAIVGAIVDDTAAGADSGTARVFVHVGASWSEEATLAPSEAAAGDYFGCAVAITADGSRAIVGGYYDDTASGTDSGSARVFVRSGSTWTEEAALIASDLAPDDYSGRAVAISADGSVALVGTPFHDTAGVADSGAVTVFVRAGSSWTEQATLESPAPFDTGLFGDSVALSGDGTRALVGADGEAFAAGLAYVLASDAGAWTLEATLSASGSAGSDYFGYSVALSSDGARALVGVYGDDAGMGTARVFERSGSTWTEALTLSPSARTAGEYFGYSVALDAGRHALIGAIYDGTRGSNAGSAWAFDLSR